MLGDLHGISHARSTFLTLNAIGIFLVEPVVIGLLPVRNNVVMFIIHCRKAIVPHSLTWVSKHMTIYHPISLDKKDEPMEKKEATDESVLLKSHSKPSTHGSQVHQKTTLDYSDRGLHHMKILKVRKTQERGLNCVGFFFFFSY